MAAESGQATADGEQPGQTDVTDVMDELFTTRLREGMDSRTASGGTVTGWLAVAVHVCISQSATVLLSCPARQRTRQESGNNWELRRAREEKAKKGALEETKQPLTDCPARRMLLQPVAAQHSNYLTLEENCHQPCRTTERARS
ncbi:hypothetical protein I7I50_10722 [Histoplasma capsulatum G186AR]|uniref:Uncharacterized protein n=1 Tax=Ajellomyces capsulatus TaxID=5037 RepID=A0A8H7Z460_AJECA|nr:hypothetical protein I7I52_01960 [Histoplasma capsulatum]QSS69433.1 hypothetical protein I7I50_10722 [Histoplasma capsulatum G186AR]